MLYSAVVLVLLKIAHVHVLWFFWFLVFAILHRVVNVRKQTADRVFRGQVKRVKVDEGEVVDLYSQAQSVKALVKKVLPTVDSPTEQWPC